MKRWASTIALTGVAILVWPDTSVMGELAWTWVNPLPQGNPLYGVWSFGPNDVYAVGTRGTLMHYDGSTWSVVQTVTPNGLNDVWGSASNDVFAVGAAGTIVHYDGTSWSTMTSGTTETLYSVWGSGPTDVFAVGNAGKILHYNGSVWSTMTSGTTKNLCDVCGTGPADVWTVGYDGAVRHYNGSSWSSLTTGIAYSTADFVDVWCVGTNNVYALANDTFTWSGGTIFYSYVYQYNGTTWSLVYNGYAEELILKGVWAGDADNVFVAATNVWGEGRLLRFDGSTWSLTDMPWMKFRAIHGSAADDVYIVGEAGLVLRFDGTNWSSQASESAGGIYDAWGSGPNDVFAVYGNDVLHYDGSTWSTMITGAPTGLQGIWGTGPDDVFAVGLSGTIVHYDGSSWSSMSSGTTQLLNALCGSGPDNVFAVGASGTICRYDGSAWSIEASGTTKSLSGAWCSGPNDAFAVGDSGTILHFDGLTWSPMTSGTTYALYDVWGTGSANVFASGANGTILRYDGATWSPMTSGTTSQLRAIWGTTTNDVFAVGESGTIRHYDGSTWSWMWSPTAAWLRDVWGSGASDVYAVGENGTILHYGSGPPIPGQLMNPGFETPAYTTGGWPTGFGYWRGDYSEIVTADNGIAPSEGDRMLKFIATSGPNAPASTGASQVVQLVDLRGLSAQIAEGYTHARFRARFNRVTGDAQTDTRFTTDLFAYAGEPNSFPTQFNQSTHLGRGRGAVISDGDPNTWQSATAELTLPVGTDFIAVVAAAEENIYNDTTEPEFDGHYCDAVTLEVFRSEHVLTLSVVNGSWGSVEAEPNLSTYPAGTPVTLTATPIEGKYFRHWEVYDPCHPNDANYVTYDANETTTIVMNADRQVTAVFKCSSGVEQMLLLAIVGLCVLGFVARWRRQRR